jgi:hypothetical protein
MVGLPDSRRKRPPRRLRTRQKTGNVVDDIAALGTAGVISYKHDGMENREHFLPIFLKNIGKKKWIHPKVRPLFCLKSMLIESI